VKADGNEVEAVMQLTKGFGAEAVIDFVGEKGSTKKGLEMTRALGNYYIVGYGENITISALDLITTERNIVGNLVGTWADLNELMSLADRGLVHLSTVEYALKDADQALHDLNAGKIKGRAILIP
jgi:NAD+-dependent secondary alcohol dehydrogenase Adh1